MSIYPNTLGHFLDAAFPRPPLQPPPWIVVAAEGGCRLAYWPPGLGPAPTPEQVASWDPAPLTDVEIAIRQAASNFEQARLAAPKALDRLKGTIHTALVSGGMSSDEATAAGVGLVLMHGPVLAAFEAAGGHPVAAAALYQAIASKPSTDALPWLTKEILDVFAAFLVPK